MGKNTIVKFKGIAPKIHDTSYIADGAVVAGDATIKKNANIWFNSVVRADVAPIIIGENTNIQDGTIIHTSRFNGYTYIAKNVTVGHMSMLHACSIEDNAFIGMQALVMDKAIIEEYGFVAAGSLISPNKVVRTKELWAGRPAKFIRMVTDEEFDFMKENIQNYIDLANEYKS